MFRQNRRFLSLQISLQRNLSSFFLMLSLLPPSRLPFFRVPLSHPGPVQPGRGRLCVPRYYYGDRLSDLSGRIHSPAPPFRGASSQKNAPVARILHPRLAWELGAEWRGQVGLNHRFPVQSRMLYR